jgi:hypothetical protein
MKLSSTDPLGGFTDALKDALKGVKDLRDELAKLGAPKIAIPKDLSAGAGAGGGVTSVAPATQAEIDSILSRGLDISFQNYLINNPQTLRVVIDPTAAQYGIGVASVNNSANGNKNNYNSLESFAGGFR